MRQLRQPKWFQQVLLRASLPRAPGARMMAVNQLPQNSPRRPPIPQNWVPRTKKQKAAGRKTMQNPASRIPNGAMWCKLWPKTILGQTKPSQASSWEGQCSKTLVFYSFREPFGILIMRPVRQLKWCQQVLLRVSLPRASGARMTAVNQLPQINVTLIAA